MRVIAGVRNEPIGSLTEKQPIVLVWKAAKAPIQIFTSRGEMLVSSQARNGRIRLALGHYAGLRVSSPGQWSLQLRVAV